MEHSKEQLFLLHWQYFFCKTAYIKQLPSHIEDCRVFELTTEVINYSWEKKTHTHQREAHLNPEKAHFLQKDGENIFDHLTYVNQPKAVFKSIARDMVYFSKKALKSLLQKPI